MEVKEGSKEFQEVARVFERSVGRRVRIVKIERIQNNQLWQAYQAHKQDTVWVTPAGTPAERMLYHGCPVENVASINSNGFVTNLAGAHVGECVHTVCRQTQFSMNTIVRTDIRAQTVYILTHAQCLHPTHPYIVLGIENCATVEARQCTLLCTGLIGNWTFDVMHFCFCTSGRSHAWPRNLLCSRCKLLCC